jgi:hypothetical protein
MRAVTSWRRRSPSAALHSKTSSSWICRSIEDDAVDHVGGLVAAEVGGVRAEAGVEIDHREFDEVGGGALHHGVDRESLGEGAA